MAKYQWQGNVLSIDFEVEGLKKFEVDTALLSDAVQQAAMKFGLQTALRNATAGKMDDPAEGHKALAAKLAVFDSGVWEKAGESKAKIELSAEEKAAVVEEVVIAARRAKGDTRTSAEIIAAFKSLSEDRAKGVLDALAKPIEKKLKARLADRKKLGKVEGAEF